MDSSEASELTKHATNVIDKARFFMFLLHFLLVLSVNRTRSFTLCDMDENYFFHVALFWQIHLQSSIDRVH